MKKLNQTFKARRFLDLYLKTSLLFIFMCISTIAFAQVNTGGSATTSDHQKQIIGYITNWDAWKNSKAGVPEAGALTHLNIDYSKYTILNYSFFGVARDGSLHSGDHRNKNIYQDGVTQEPADLFYTDLYSSWDLHLLFGELEYVNYVNEDIKRRAEAQGFQVEVGASTWTHPVWGLSGGLPLPLKKENGAPGLLDLAHQKGVKVMASIGGWSMCKHFPEMAADPVKRAKFIEDCKRLINIGFDGIDLDWEYPGPFSGMNFTGSQADFANFESLLQEIRNAIGPTKLITSAMAADPRKLDGFNWSGVVANMDYFNMMTYDYNGGWSNKAGHNAPVYPYTDAEVSFFNWQSTLQKLVEAGVPKNKICFGAPFYGRGVVTEGNADLNVKTVKRAETVQPDGPIQTAADYTNWPKEVYDGTPNYFFIKQKALSPNSGWTRKWDDEAKVPYLVNGKYFLSYDDEESIGIKAQFINDNELAGTIIWTVYGDLEFGGTATSFGRKLKRWSDVKSPLVNKINEVFANGGSGGNVSPTVNITAPANNATFTEGDTVLITANAADSDGTITKVEFYNGSIKLGEDTTSPYEYSWASVAAGNYTLTAKATDNGNASTTSSAVSISVNGSGTNTPPVVNITEPANNATFTEGTTIVIKANASDPDADGSITKVEFYNGTTLLGEDTTAPYEYSWANVAKGNYTLTAKATDDKNATTVSSGVSVTVNGSTGGDNCSNFPTWSATEVYTGGKDVKYNNVHYQAKWWTQNQNPETNSNPDGVWKKIGPCDNNGGGNNVPPTVSIASPANNTTFVEGTSVDITANASDSDGTITKVEFFNGATKLGEDTSSPYTYTISNASVGSYTLTAKATDNEGATSTSSAISISVTTGGGNGSCDGVPQYVAGTSYSKDQEVQNEGEKFKCNIPGWCSSAAAWAYAPGTGAHWQSAWSKTGDCTVRNSAVSVFPNPTENGIINVMINSGKSNSNFRFEVHSLNGTKLLDFENNVMNGKNGKTFDISSLKTGLYLYTITIGKEKEYGKMKVSN
ncbi:hypothetical protein ATO12_15490 [Aquimarina atlantica]|uniref:chitinase n=1 Tax=Aquimarina atlantica TaxID=1317122 RepID=A0A023BW51_9FLAO|nr:glycosyl hydrolase family 18 protein [Aquimarina atlantica]EZH74267.1 hypothetical protein ATO12_15490 [Aquimarina atlantica]